MKTKRKRLADRIIEYPVNNREDGKKRITEEMISRYFRVNRTPVILANQIIKPVIKANRFTDNLARMKGLLREKLFNLTNTLRGHPLFNKDITFFINTDNRHIILMQINAYIVHRFLHCISSGTSRTVYINFLSLFRGSGRHLSLLPSVHIDNLYGGVRC